MSIFSRAKSLYKKTPLGRVTSRYSSKAPTATTRSQYFSVDNRTSDTKGSSPNIFSRSVSYIKRGGVLGSFNRSGSKFGSYLGGIVNDYDRAKQVRELRKFSLEEAKFNTSLGVLSNAQIDQDIKLVEKQTQSAFGAENFGDIVENTLGLSPNFLGGTDPLSKYYAEQDLAAAAGRNYVPTQGTSSTQATPTNTMPISNILIIGGAALLGIYFLTKKR